MKTDTFSIHTALLLFSLFSAGSAPAIYAAEGAPPADSKEFGQTLVAEYDIPADVVEKFNAFIPPAPKKGEAPLFNALLADTADWIGPFFPVNSTKNPYRVVVTLSGYVKAKGDAVTMWQGGWRLDDGVTRRTVIAGLTKLDVNAGERVVLTAASAPNSFAKDMQVAASLGLIKAQNLDIKSVHVQVWSGVASASPVQAFMSMNWLVTALVFGFLTWLWRRR